MTTATHGFLPLFALLLATPQSVIAISCPLELNIQCLWSLGDGIDCSDIPAHVDECVTDVAYRYSFQNIGNKEEHVTVHKIVTTHENNNTTRMERMDRFTVGPHFPTIRPGQKSSFWDHRAGTNVCQGEHETTLEVTVNTMDGKQCTVQAQYPKKTGGVLDQETKSARNLQDDELKRLFRHDWLKPITCEDLAVMEYNNLFRICSQYAAPNMMCSNICRQKCVCDGASCMAEFKNQLNIPKKFRKCKWLLKNRDVCCTSESARTTCPQTCSGVQC